jgi:hypothetical protein
MNFLILVLVTVKSKMEYTLAATNLLNTKTINDDTLVKLDIDHHSI